MKTLIQLLIFSLCLGCVTADETRKPNVLFIAVDDLNAWVTHLGRNKQAKTPNIDRLAKMGTTFTQAYCAVPACNPARAALMTGQRPWTTACYMNGNPWKQYITEGLGLSAQFKKGGYHVAGAGKIYHAQTYYESEWSDYLDPKSYSLDGKGVKKYQGYHEPLPHDLKDENLGDWHIVNWCIEQLEKEHEKPLFLACGLYKPHLPFAVPRKYYDMFPRDQIQLPPHRKDDLDDVPAAGVKMANPKGDHAKFLKTGRWKDAIQSYLATCAYTDMNIGRLLDALKKSPHADNTIVVLWGDHGWSFGEKSHWRKFALWEEPTRAPLIWVAPGVTKAGTACERSIDFMTIYPTLCELTGIETPKHVEGKSAVSLLRDPTSPWKHPAITTHGYKNHAVRTDTHRYIQYADGSEELYDHTDDPYEWVNLATKSESVVLMKELRKHLPEQNAKPRKGKPKKGRKRAAVPAADGKSATLKFDFEKDGALSEWSPTQADQWVITDTKSDRGKALHLLGASKAYRPPFRSPLSINLLKGKVFGDFVLTAKVKTLQTSRGHRDMCIFWGWQDPSHFYYVHLGEKVDPNSSQIFIVKEAPRTPITTANAGGIPWKDDTWHDVKLVRKVKEGTIEVYFDDMDKPMKVAKDRTFQWGMIGLGSFDDLGMWDDVRINGQLIEGKSPVLPKPGAKAVPPAKAASQPADEKRAASNESSRGEHRKKPSKPNVVFILADDMGFDSVSANNPKIGGMKTPNIDRLISQGMNFTDAHSGSAVCTPTRYGLLTGRYCWRTDLKNSVLWKWGAPLIEQDRLTVAQMLKNEGYETGMVGKWHLGFDWYGEDGKIVNVINKDLFITDRHFGDDPEQIARLEAIEARVDFSKPVSGGPTDRGFDYFYGVDVPNFPPYVWIENERIQGIPSVPKPKEMFGASGPMLPGWKLEEILPGVARRGGEWIMEQGGKEKPFFLYLPLTSPHSPIAPSGKFEGTSGISKYADFVIETDWVVGHIMEALEQAGVAENTLVIFTTDNGTSNEAKFKVLEANGVDLHHHLRAHKGSIYEGGHRVPFIVRWPGKVEPGSTCDEVIGLNDFMATMAELLGVVLPENAAEDSYSILPLVTGDAKTLPGRPMVVNHSYSGAFAIRDGQWKLLPGKKPRLFDLSADLKETTDVAARYPERVTSMEKTLKAYQENGRSHAKR